MIIATSSRTPSVLLRSRLPWWISDSWSSCGGMSFGARKSPPPSGTSRESSSKTASSSCDLDGPGRVEDAALVVHAEPGRVAVEPDRLVVLAEEREALRVHQVALRVPADLAGAREPRQPVGAAHLEEAAADDRHVAVAAGRDDVPGGEVDRLPEGGHGGATLASAREVGLEGGERGDPPLVGGGRDVGEVRRDQVLVRAKRRHRERQRDLCLFHGRPRYGWVFVSRARVAWPSGRTCLRTGVMTGRGSRCVPGACGGWKGRWHGPEGSCGGRSGGVGRQVLPVTPGSSCRLWPAAVGYGAPSRPAIRASQPGGRDDLANTSARRSAMAARTHGAARPRRAQRAGVRAMPTDAPWRAPVGQRQLPAGQERVDRTQHLAHYLGCYYQAVSTMCVVEVAPKEARMIPTSRMHPIAWRSEERTWFDWASAFAMTHSNSTLGELAWVVPDPRSPRPPQTPPTPGESGPVPDPVNQIESPRSRAFVRRPRLRPASGLILHPQPFIFPAAAPSSAQPSSRSLSLTSRLLNPLSTGRGTK